MAFSATISFLDADPVHVFLIKAELPQGFSQVVTLFGSARRGAWTDRLRLAADPG
ncbi:MAG TPA: hypothetical protein VN776_00670 [Terracidiphilus sp.]|nr:hypothetical protein [Terracidiphilus sp.]